MSRRKIIITVVLFVIAGGAMYGYKEYTRKVMDLAKVRAQVQMQAADLIAAFEKNEVLANAQYLDKIIAVKGAIKAVEKNDKGYYSIVLGHHENMSSVRCSMDSIHQQEVTGLTAGALVTIKGACTGFNADELLGSDVILNRCVLDK